MAKKTNDNQTSGLSDSEKRFVMDIAMHDGKVSEKPKPKTRTLKPEKKPFKFTKKQLTIGGIVAGAVFVLILLAVSFAIKTPGSKVIYKIGNVSITEQQIKQLSQDIAANKTKDQVNPNNLTDEQYATQQLILHAALVTEGKKAGVDVSEAGLDKLLENEYKTKGGNRQAYRERLLEQKLRPEAIFIYKENEALKSKLADNLIQTKELSMTYSRWDSIPEDVRPAAEQKARKLLATKFLPLYTNGTPAEEIAKLADINPSKSREENDKLVESQMTANPPTSAGAMKYNAESSNYIDYDDTPETKETLSANKKVAALKKKGDVTGVFRSRSGMNMIIRLEKDPVGKYTSWDDMVKSYQKSSKVGLLSDSLQSAVASLKTQKVYASHPGNWGGDHTGAPPGPPCTNHNINYLITLRDDATGAWINNAGINVSNNGRCPYSYQENLAASGLAGVGYNYFIQNNCNGPGWKWDFNIPGYFNTPSGYSSSAGGASLSGSSYLPPFAGVGNGALVSVDITFTHVPPPPPPPADGWTQFIPKLTDPKYSNNKSYFDKECLIGGWVFDTAAPRNQNLQVDIYWDGPANPSRPNISTRTGQYWSGVSDDGWVKKYGPIPDDPVNNKGYGFFLQVPPTYRDGNPHTAYVYAHRAGGGAFELHYTPARPLTFNCSPPAPTFTPWIQTKQGNVTSEKSIVGQSSGGPGGRDNASADKEAEFVVISQLGGSKFCSSNAYAFGSNQYNGGAWNCNIGKYALNHDYIEANSVVSNVTSITSDNCKNNPYIASLASSSSVPGPDVSKPDPAKPSCANGTIWKYPDGNVVLSGGSFNRGRATIYAKGDLHITSNITATGAGPYEGEFVPNLGVVVDGNVIIDEGVQRIDAAIFATGTIKTCGDNYKSPSSPKCTNRLEVHGLLASANGSKSFEFGRRYIDAAALRGGSGAGAPAEYVVYQGKILGFPPPGFTVTRNKVKERIKYESGLPPRF